MTSPRQLVVSVCIGGSLLAGCSPPADVVTGPADEPSDAVADERREPDDERQVAPPVLEPDPDPEPEPEPEHPWSDRRHVGQPYGQVPGLLMFRGNPTRTYYGAGLPDAPELAWRYPDGPMCSDSTAGGVTREWCGTGWTGQPALWERPDGVLEAVVGAYDGAFHFVDAATGEPTRTPLPTGDLVKGSVTIDPDGYELVYGGSRDGKLRVIALDRGEPEVLWELHAHPQGVWNDDWDGNPLVYDDLLLVGGEDSWLYVYELNRHRDVDGLVQVDPVQLFEMPGFTDELFADIGDRAVSFEASVALFEGVLFAANSGGRILGVDITRVRETGEAPIVFDWWAGDDVDATPMLDSDGMLYIGVQYERKTARASEIGQLLKLDPTRPDDPLVWNVHIPPRSADEDGGVWATPALYETDEGSWVYVTSHAGDLWVVDAGTGEVSAQLGIGFHEWSSPQVVDGKLLLGECQAGRLSAWSLDDPGRPERVWEVEIPTGGCVESTAAVWDGHLVVGSRDGYLYGFR
jgi:outer membrane protein assembly factor BamB